MEGRDVMEQPSRVDRYGSLVIDLITNALMIIFFFMYPPFSLVKYIAIFIPVVYYPILHIICSRSIGDIVFGLKIVDQHGNRISYKLALDRFFCVLKYSCLLLIFTNLLFISFFLRTGRDIRDFSLDFQRESKTYLVKAN